MWAPGREYESRVPVGVRGDTKPLFVVQVLVSNALLRDTLIPGIRRIVATASLAYLVALALVWVVAEITRRNLRRIGELIDRIGEAPVIGDDGPRAAAATVEFDAVESKLSLMEDVSGEPFTKRKTTSTESAHCSNRSRKQSCFLRASALC